MDLISILATVILATTIATVIMGFVAYAAFKIRENRKPGRALNLDLGNTGAEDEPIFFSRYVTARMDKDLDLPGTGFE